MRTSILFELKDQAAESNALVGLGRMLQPCIQCGSCTGSCPNAFAMDHTPRQLWRMVQWGDIEQIFQSNTFALCSACYLCRLRCPRGLPLTEAMAALKQLGQARQLAHQRASFLFYRNFIQSIRRHGRVNEMALMARYFVQMKSIALPFRFMSLGAQLLKKGKINVLTTPQDRGALESLFRQVETVETEQRRTGP